MISVDQRDGVPGVGRLMSCPRDRPLGDAGPVMLPVAAGCCGLISLGTTSRDLGMFGPLERAKRPSLGAACTQVAARIVPSAASIVVLSRVI